MLSTNDKINPGDAIIAPPRMQGSNFAKSVILITTQRGGGHFGLCLNKPSNHRLSDLSLELDCDLPEDYSLYWGGPVGTQTIWMLHSSEWSIDATQEINTHWSMTSHKSMFHHLADRDCPNNFIMTFGFSGWAKGQLEQELLGLPPYTVDSSWLTWLQPDQHILEVASDELWRVSCEQSSHQAVNTWMT